MRRASGVGGRRRGRDLAVAGGGHRHRRLVADAGRGMRTLALEGRRGTEITDASATTARAGCRHGACRAATREWGSAPGRFRNVLSTTTSPSLSSLSIDFANGNHVYRLKITGITHFMAKDKVCTTSLIVLSHVFFFAQT